MRIPLSILQLVVTSTTLFAFQQFPLIFWMGRVVSVEGQTIHATSGPQGTLTNLTITLASGGKVWKKTSRNDFSAIRVGDEIWVRGYRTALGELAATEIYANITRFEGVITNVTANGYEVEVHNVEGTPVGRKIVTVDAGTVTGRDLPLSMKDVQKGRFVETIGLKLPDGRVAATRVIVSVNGRPVDMPPDAIIRDSRGNPVRK